MKIAVRGQHQAWTEGGVAGELTDHSIKLLYLEHA